MDEEVVKSLTKSEQVYNYIKDLILTGELKPNERIIISKIASDLGVSIIPVREALRKLGSQGLVELASQRGARVSKVDIEELDSIFEVRMELETLATKLAVKNASEQEVKILNDLCEKMNDSVKLEDVQTYTLLNRKFHNILYRSSKNLVLVDMIDNLYARSENSKMIFNYDFQRMKDSNKEHKLIVESISQKNEELAVSTMRKQKEIGFNTVLHALKLSQSYYGE